MANKINKDKSKARTKTTRKSIKLSLITELKNIAGKLGPLTKAVEKEIKKSAGDIAKKITKEMVVEESALAVIDEKTEDAVLAKTAPVKKKKTQQKPEAEPVKV